MLKLLDRFYYLCPQRNIAWLGIRFCIRVLANIYVRYFMPIRSRKTEITKDTIIISLTSFPARINNIWMNIATLLNQNVDNIHVILWLSVKQFDGEESLPKSLLKLKAKGLDIRFVDDDLRPHKKYYYTILAYPDNDFITVDDDILYRPDIISILIRCHIKFPQCIICNKAVIISKSPYSSWSYNRDFQKPLSNILPTGVGGVYYPAHIFDNSPLHNINGIKKTCLNADDIWLNFISRYKNRHIVQTGLGTELLSIIIPYPSQFELYDDFYISK